MTDGIKIISDKDVLENERSLETIVVYLAYSPKEGEQLYHTAKVTRGTSIIELLKQVGWLDKYAELSLWCQQQSSSPTVGIDNKSWRVGVYAQKKPLNYVLQPQDRVEVYRPLLIDPMRKREKRAVQQRT